MIQLQYYNKGLTKTQIEQILNNYKLKRKNKRIIRNMIIMRLKQN